MMFSVTVLSLAVVGSTALPHIRLQNGALRIPTLCQTTTNTNCVFPFKYKGQTYNQCTYTESPTPWCATLTDNNGDVIVNNWGDCDVSATSSCLSEPTTLCQTTTNTNCVFPFKYKGQTYNQCTYTESPTPWCATLIDNNGDVIVNNWGDCDVSATSSCLSEPTTTPNPTTTTTSTLTPTTPSSGTCTPGQATYVDCNICVCSSDQQLVCTRNICSTTTSTSAPSTCTTVSGPASGTPCVFPFTFDGVTHNSCAEWVYGGVNEGSTWCSTKVDIFGDHVNTEGNYGICGSNCPTASKSVGSQKSGSGGGSVRFGDSGSVP